MKTFILIFLILFLSCQEKTKTEQEEVTDKPTLQFELNTSDYTILNLEPKNNWIFKNAKLSELNQLELVEAEKILKIAVEKITKFKKRI